MEYRSGVTGGLHPEMDIFPDLSPRSKPYCGVKCSQGPLRNMLSKIYISRNKCHLNNIKYLICILRKIM